MVLFVELDEHMKDILVVQMKKMKLTVAWPNSCQFPKVTPLLSKHLEAWRIIFVDAEGTLWCSGNDLYVADVMVLLREFDSNEGYTEGELNMSATDIGDDPIDKVFSFYDYYRKYYYKRMLLAQQVKYIPGDMIRIIF